MQKNGWLRTALTTGSICLLLAVNAGGSAPIEQAWEQTYNGGYEDNLQAMALDGEGNVYVLGYTANASNYPSLLTIKYASDGTELWESRYDYGLPTALAVNAIGEAWITAYAGGTVAAYLTIKYDPNGNELWVRRLEGANQWGTEPKALVVDASGNAIVTGVRRVTDAYNQDQITTVKYSPAGDELWVREGGDSMTSVTGLAVDDGGNVIVTGNVEGVQDLVDVLTIKYNPTGDVQWAAHYDGGNSGPQSSAALAVNRIGNVYLAGGESGKILSLKYSPAGTLLWNTSYGVPPGQVVEARAIKVDNGGNVYITGEIFWQSAHGLMTVKLGPTGDRAWAARYNPQKYYGWHVFGGLALDSAGNAYLRDLSSFLAIKYAPDGNFRWAVSKPSGYARTVAISESGDVYLAGNIPPTNPMSPRDYDDFDLLKYTQSEIPSQPRAFVTPVEQEAIAGSNVVFNASVVGPGPLSYQWRSNGQPLSGQTNSTLSFSVQPADVADYSVIVSNAAGYTISPEARLTKVHVPATITSIPQTNKVVVGDAMTFVVTVIGDSPLSVQWQFNGEPIASATNTSLALANLQESDSGLYTVVVSNAYAVAVSAAYQLTVFRSPIELSLKGSWVTNPNTNGFAEAVRVAGGYAYLANARAGLEIIDVSNPTAPIRVANYQTGGFVQDVEVAGNYAYVADFYTGLHVLDVHDPTHPVLVGRYDADGDYGVMDTPNVLQLVGTLLYLVDAEGELQILDVSTPSNPFHVATLGACDYTPRCGYIKGFFIKGSKAFFVGEYYDEISEDDFGFLQIFDLTQPTNPTAIDFTFTGCESGYGVDVANGYAYIAGSCALSVVDVSKGTNSAVVGKFDPSYGYAQAVQLRGDYAFLAGEFLGLAAVDVSDPTDPVLVARVPMGTGQDEGWDVQLVGNYAYVARGDLGLLIFEIDETRYFSSITRAGNKLTLHWNGTRGVKLQRCGSLSATVWEDVAGSDGISSMELPIGSGNGFFRLRRD